MLHFKSNDVCVCVLLQVGWYSDNSGLHIDLDEDGSFPDYYEDENEIGVTQIPKFTEKVRSSPLVTNSRYCIYIALYLNVH